mgnify:CR=1 FL=1
MEDNSENIKLIFDSCVELYWDKFMDPDRYQLSLDLFSQYLQSDFKVLDVGCGPGNLSAYLQKKHPAIKFFGIDLSSKMLQLAKENLPGGEFQQMDCRNLDRLPKKFDAVICGFCLPYLSRKDSKNFLKKVSSQLNSEGIVYLSTMVAKNYASNWVKSNQGGDQKLLTYYHQADELKETLLKYDFSILYDQQMEEQERDGVKFRDQIIIARKNGSGLITDQSSSQEVI